MVCACLLARVFRHHEGVNVRRLVSLFLVMAAVFAAVPAVQAAIERSVERSFPGVSGVRLKIRTSQGAIRAEASPDDQIHVLVRFSMDAESEEAAEVLMREVDVVMEQVEAEISVNARFRRSLRWIWDDWPPVTLAYLVKIPRGCGLDLSTVEGDVIVANVEGDARLRTERGAIFTGEVHGSLDACSGRGDVSVTACTGDLLVAARSGNILVGRSGGVTRLSGADGLIEVQNARGNLEIDADGADIKVGFAHPCTESGVLKASGGDVEVIFDTRSACTIRAQASRFGRVRLKKFPGVIESGREGAASLVATLNGGGPLMKINASGGSIRLSGREP